MFAPYTASQGSHWLPVELPGHPRAAKLIFKASKKLVRGTNMVLGQSSHPLKNCANTQYIAFLCHFQPARIAIGSQRRSQDTPDQQN